MLSAYMILWGHGCESYFLGDLKNPETTNIQSESVIQGSRNRPNSPQKMKYKMPTKVSHFYLILWV